MFGGGDVWKAVKKGDLKTVQKLVPKKVDVKQKDKEGKTLLHYAVASDTPSIEIVEHLLNNGAQVDTMDGEGCTALHVGLRRVLSNSTQHDSVCVLLVKRGADIEVEAKDKEGKSAIDKVQEAPPTYRRFQMMFKEAVDFHRASKAVPASPPQTQNNSPTQNQTAQTQTTTNQTNNTPTQNDNSTLPPATHNLPPTAPTSPIAETWKPKPIPEFIVNLPEVPLPTDTLQLMDFLMNDLAEDLPPRATQIAWIDFCSKICDLLLCDPLDKIAVRVPVVSNMSKATDALTKHYLTYHGLQEFKSKQSNKIMLELSGLPERVTKLEDAVRGRGPHSKTYIQDWLSGPLTFGGAAYYLFEMVNQVSQEKVVEGMTDIALSCKQIMEAVNSGNYKDVSPLLLEKIIRLVNIIGDKIFEVHDLEKAKKMSDSVYIIAKTFKTLLLIPLLAQGPLDNTHINTVISMTKLTAEQLGAIKEACIDLLPSRRRGVIPAQDEQEMYTIAQTKFTQILEVCKTSPNTIAYSSELITHFEAQIQLIKVLPDLVFAIPFPHPMRLNGWTPASYDLTFPLIHCVKALLHTTRKIRAVYIHRIVEMEKHARWSQIQLCLDSCCKFACQIVIGVVSLCLRNNVCPRLVIASAVRSLVLCNSLLIDLFCIS
eukprot:TRINITY_DN524_c0_g3_i1.p1 TRINITY_DN524_c0_g3~~TRINITY_DN524_c0_g3_i1.p1  ORF type:complete len:653 (-),score=113.49 TRINITY_DN524_c0_g3_i1:39-1997(-)